MTLLSTFAVPVEKMQYKTAQTVSSTLLILSGMECMCPPGFVKVEKTRFDFIFDCVACPSGQAPTQDGLKCLPCGSPATFNPDSKSCTCPNGSKVVSYALDGSKLQ